ncbi:uncharacterized protein J3R85_007247 [Psidium guajava]|nr:uncharacterized protein J3R85_007247 [Psidium guajava]
MKKIVLREILGSPESTQPESVNEENRNLLELHNDSIRAGARSPPIKKKNILELHYQFDNTAEPIYKLKEDSQLPFPRHQPHSFKIRCK